MAIAKGKHEYDMLFTNNSFYTIRYTEALSMVEVIWHRMLQPAEYREGAKKVLQLIHQQQVAHLLVDARKLGPFNTGEQGWIRETIFPQVNKLKILKFARVTDPDLFSQTIISNLMQQVQSQVEFAMQSFYSREDALEWLLQEE